MCGAVYKFCQEYLSVDLELEELIMLLLRATEVYSFGKPQLVIVIRKLFDKLITMNNNYITIINFYQFNQSSIYENYMNNNPQINT